MKRVVVAFGALGLWVAAVARAGMPPMPVVVAPTERGVVRQVLPTVGTVRGLREVKVGSRLAERVAELLVDDGDEVSKDETVIAKLDVTTTKLMIQEAQARLDEAKATLAKAVAGLRAMEIKQEEAALAALDARVKKLEADVRRSKTLFETKVIADSEHDAVLAERDIAKAMAAGARAKLALAREGTRQEDIAKARADVALRQAALDMAEQRKKDSVIVSPVDGHVVRKHVEVGEWTLVGGTVVEIVDTSVLRVHTRVTEKEIRKIHQGQEVTIRLDAHPDKTLKGTVHRIVPKADVASRSFPVQVTVTEPGKVVRPGMFARTEFVLDERPNCLLVPEDALVYRGGLAMVFKAGGPPPGMAPGGGAGRPPTGPGGAPPAPKGAPPPKLPGPVMFAHRVIVKPGVRQDGKMEIREVVDGSLEAGELVVVVGSENMRQGAMVIVVRGLPPAMLKALGSPGGPPKAPPAPPGGTPKERGK